ncbi:MAG TPA: response regulator transcription factor, partial [Nocardioides sp.]|uniref:response regulator transcription factor n=1 Tax=Nocardioides alcanivorans TaxID=2897352 RepID=UPI001F36A862|nr:response regulator transcription factor [Nocardioides alcanivorans]
MTHPPADTAPTAGDVLVVDDEEPLARVVASYLEAADFSVRLAHTGPDAVAMVAQDPDVVILDLGLPGLDGVEVCRQIRTRSDCYILMLTARSEELDKLIGLSVGADDYMTKPFSPRELVARVQVLMRRPRAGAPAPAADLPDPVRVGPLSIDLHVREVLLDGTVIDLTRTEFDVLAALAAQPRMAFGRLQILQSAWGPSWVGDEHVVDVHVGHIRRKLNDDPASPRFIETVRGVGYRLGRG